MTSARTYLFVSLLAAVMLEFGVWAGNGGVDKVGHVTAQTGYSANDTSGHRQFDVFHRPLLPLLVASPGNGRGARHDPSQSAHRHLVHSIRHHPTHGARHHLTQGPRHHLSRSVRLGYPDPWQSLTGRSPYPARRGIVKAMSLARGRYDGAISVRLVSNPTLADYRLAWDQLYDTTDCEPSASYEWTEALMLAYRSDIGEPLLAIAEDRHAIRGLVPLMLTTEKRFGLAIHVLSPLSDRYHTHSDLLVERGAAEAIVQALFGRLLASGVRWDIFQLRRVFDGNAIALPLAAGARSAGLPCLARRYDPAFVLALDASYDAWLKRRSGRFRNNLKRMGRKLAEAGAVHYRKTDGSRSLEEEYQCLLAVEAGSWKHAHGTSIDCISAQRLFYETLCRLAFAKRRLHLAFIELEGQPVAYTLGLLKGETYYLLKTSYLESLKLSGAATIAKARLVEDLIASGVTRLDLGPDLYEWKRVWADSMQWHTGLSIFNRTARGYAIGVGKWLSQRAGDRRDRDLHYCNPRDLRVPDE